MQPGEGSSAGDVLGESSESTLQLNIKTLDSQICSFNVDKNTVVSAFKDKIASQISVPVEQQRLIFRGKVLKDDHLLSEYNLENGDTLHLVERQPLPSPGEATSSNGLNSNYVAPQNLIGQIAHSVILGTLNVGESGDAVIPDLSRVIGAVLNSMGIGNAAGGLQPGFQSLLGNETEGSQMNAGSQSGSYPMQAPTGTTMELPTLNMPIPESLSTLTEFMNRMEVALSRTGTRENQSAIPSTQLPTDSLGYPTLEALTIVLQHAQRLLRDHAVPALSDTASRLDQEGGSNDPAVRREVHTESVQFGVAMQHLGALFLELGRTMLTLRLGQSSGECLVNSGPAVYISPSGPNPIMVQPFPLQTSSLFADSSGVMPNPIPMSPASVGSVPRNVNIHIHTGTTLEPIVPTAGNRAPTGEETQGERVNGTGEDDTSNQRRSSETSQTSAHPTVNMDNAKAQNQPTNSSGEGHRSKSSTSEHAETLTVAGKYIPGNDKPNESSATPLGLGMGGLQPRRNRLPRSQSKKTEGSSSSTNQHQKSTSASQPVLQSRASLPVRREPPNSPSPDRPRPEITRIRSVPPARQNNNIDVTDAMSQVLQSPSLDGLLAGVSQQTGVGSPDMLRNMLQQFTENPAMRNTVNHLAEQIDSHDLGSMFYGLDCRGQGGGIDLSRMMQQMMPIVSQTLGGLSSVPGSDTLQSGIGRGVEVNDDPQIDQGFSDEIFRSLVERAAYIYGDGHDEQGLVNALCSQRGLAQEFIEMLRSDVSRRLEDGMMF